MRISDWSSDVCSSDLNAVLDVMFAPDFLPHVERSGKLLRRKLEDLAARFPHVLAEVRGAGLMLGLKCVVTNTDLVARLREEGLLTVGAAENRSEERRVGNASVSTCRSRWWKHHHKNTKHSRH